MVIGNSRPGTGYEMNTPHTFGFYRLIVRNLSHRPHRTIATIIAFAIIAATFFSAHILLSGAQQSLDRGMTRMGADIMVVPAGYNAQAETVILMGEPSTFFFNDSGFEKISRINGVAKASPQIFIATLFGQACCSGPVQFIAIDPSNDFTVSAWLKENPGVTMGKDDLIVGSKITGDIGSDLRFFGHTYHIAGRLGQTGMGIDMAVFARTEDAYVMADESGVRAVQKLTIPRGMVSAVLVKLEPGTSPDTVAREILTKIPGTKTITPDGLLSAVTLQLGSVTRLLYGSTFAVTIVSIPLLAFVAAMVAHERRREIAILRALGATKSFVVRLMLAESFSIAVIGCFIGIGAASIILVLFQDFIAASLKIPFIIPSPQALLVAGVTALFLCSGIGGIASLYPAILINRSEPYETIRKGES
jgi:putative ABC transport system permease protein